MDTLANESELVERAKTDQVAFVELYHYYLPKVYAFVKRRVGHRETTEDLVSACFMKAFASLPNFQTRSNTSFAAWTYRIAANLITDHWRSQGRRAPSVDIDDLTETLTKVGERGADDLADLKIERSRLDQVLAELPEKHRQIIELKFYADLSNVEVAEVLSLTPAHIGVLVFRAVKAATKVYQQHFH